jgi:hypothetical protein
MELPIQTRARRLLAAFAIAAALAGCTPQYGMSERFLEVDTAAEESTPLGGEALAQRRQELKRAHGDLHHFLATLEGLDHRSDRNGQILFKGFLDAYMGEHLAPLLRGEWQSQHPELMGLDANLRVSQAELLRKMRDPRGVQRVIEELERRFAGRESMLVDYPIGTQSTLGDALQMLRDGKWRG